MSRQSCLCADPLLPSAGSWNPAQGLSLGQELQQNNTHHSHQAPPWLFSLRRDILGLKKEQCSRWVAQTQGKAGSLQEKFAFKCCFYSLQHYGGESHRSLRTSLTVSQAGYFGAQQKSDHSGISLCTVHTVLNLDQSFRIQSPHRQPGSYYLSLQL